MEKRLILALTLSILILAVWSIIFPPPKPNEPLSKIHPRGSSLSVESSAEKAEVTESQLIAPQHVRTKNLGEDIVIDKPLYRAVFSNQGGVLKSFQLKDYPEEKIRPEDIEKSIRFSQDEKLKARLNLLKEKLPSASGVEMVSLTSGLEEVFPLSLRWQDRDEDLNYGLYEVDKKDTNLTFSRRTADNLKIIRSYSFKEDTYLLAVEIRLINEGEKVFSASPLQIQYGPDLGLSTDPFGRGDPYYRGLVLVKEASRDKIIRDDFRRTKRGKPITRNYPDAVWGALENKYFIAAFVPGGESHSLWLEKDAAGHLNAGLKLQAPELKPGAALIKKFSLYLGPKQKEILRGTRSGLENSIDYGRVSSALKIMEILTFFYRLTRNWGLAIILLTVLTKIVLLPLTQKSFRSMEEMQRLQPHLKELRLKYKNDPRRMNKELMELYREHHVNPMSGCLPMLLQMPIFIALFTTLRNTIELRGAGFLWVKDLSQPDTIMYLAGLPLNPLPLVMGLSTFWQQKISTTDPEQARMMLFMPLIFTVMFYNFSSGLALYWFVQNILTIGHQYGMKIFAKKNGSQ